MEEEIQILRNSIWHPFNLSKIKTHILKNLKIDLERLIFQPKSPLLPLEAQILQLIVRIWAHRSFQTLLIQAEQ